MAGATALREQGVAVRGTVYHEWMRATDGHELELCEGHEVNTSLLLGAGSLLLACTSMVLARRVNYFDHLPVFNAMAAAMLVLCIAALTAGTVGTWKSRGRNMTLWLALAVAVLVLGTYVFNP